MYEITHTDEITGLDAYDVLMEMVKQVDAWDAWDEADEAYGKMVGAILDAPRSVGGLTTAAKRKASKLASLLGITAERCWDLVELAY